jgi:hypothetical protein
VQARAALVQRGKGRPFPIIDVYFFPTAHGAGGARRTEACTRRIVRGRTSIEPVGSGLLWMNTLDAWAWHP